MTIGDGQSESAGASKLNNQPDLGKVIKWDVYRSNVGLHDENADSMYQEALTYLNYYSWCGSVRESYVGMIFEGIVGIFLFRFEPTRKGIDEWVWVVVGDLPPAYLTLDECPNPGTALDGYIGAMEEWVEAAETGRSVADLIPVNLPATPENAERLRTRLAFLDRNILLKYYKDDL